MQDKNMNMKPDKDPFFEYYITDTIKSIIYHTVELAQKLWRYIIGAWWCDHCEKYHGRRVHKYTYNGRCVTKYVSSDYYICSLWLAQQKHKVSELKVPEPKVDLAAVALKATTEAMKEYVKTQD